MLINEKQKRVLAALMTNRTVESAAKAAGVSSKTVRRYLQDPEFLASYQSAVDGVMERATKQLQGSLTAAIERLGRIVRNDNDSSQAHIAAARALLDFTLRFTELNDVLTKLEQLEAWRKETEDGKH